MNSIQPCKSCGTTVTEVKPCGSFEIPDAYSGIFRVIGTLRPDNLDPMDAWTISVPEVMVPEEAGSVVLRLARERLPERATLVTFLPWDDWSGKVRRILDGDRVVLELAKGDFRVLHIANIDCPDQGQNGWKKAKDLTSRQLLGKNITFLILKDESSDAPLQYDDTPGTFVGLPVNEAVNTIAEELLRAGLAWHYTKYSADPDLARLEAEARKAGRGIWAKPNPVPPWDYRKTLHHGP